MANDVPNYVDYTNAFPPSHNELAASLAPPRTRKRHAIEDAIMADDGNDEGHTSSDGVGDENEDADQNRSQHAALLPRAKQRRIVQSDVDALEAAGVVGPSEQVMQLDHNSDDNSGEKHFLSRSVQIRSVFPTFF
jgi:hypothetical protein